MMMIEYVRYEQIDNIHCYDDSEDSHKVVQQWTYYYDEENYGSL